MFNNDTISQYYDSTFIHYRKWWKLDEYLSIHYGIWDHSTKSFPDSLLNTNRVLIELSGIKESDKVLDAGCGVGGAAFFLNEEVNAKVVGISLNQRQVEYANNLALQRGNSVSFQVMDYSHTDFENESFDVVWACESVCHSENKQEFLKESFRVLKKGGKLILCDYFLNENEQKDPDLLIKKWIELWSIPGLVTMSYFRNICKEVGFNKIEDYDYTDKIIKSARRMYFASILGAIPSEIYNLFHPGVTRFAKHHYRSGYYQYKALMRSIWSYRIFFAVK